jgi:hypothetical protein
MANEPLRDPGLYRILHQVKTKKGQARLYSLTCPFFMYGLSRFLIYPSLAL